MVAHKGFVWLEVEIAGAAAHGSTPGAVDAIARMGGVLVGTRSAQPAAAGRPGPPAPRHRLRPRLADQRRPGAVVLRRALRPRRRAAHPARARRPPRPRPSCARSSTASPPPTPGLRAEVRLGVHRAPMETPADAELPALSPPRPPRARAGPRVAGCLLDRRGLAGRGRHPGRAVRPARRRRPRREEWVTWRACAPAPRSLWPPGRACA